MLSCLGEEPPTVESHEELRQSIPLAERRAAMALLAGERTKAKVLDVVADARETAAWLLQTNGPALTPIACREGCGACCRFPVDVTAPEVISLAELIRDRWAPEAVAALRTKLAAFTAAAGAVSPALRPGRRLPCALLVDERCTIYEARPLPCRGWTSSDAQACQDGVTRPELPIPTDALRLLIHHGVQDGLWMGLRDVGYRLEVLDLGVALEIALARDDVAERWLEGEAVFLDARTQPA